jgi:hypothetical protein
VGGVQSVRSLTFGIATLLVKGATPHGTPNFRIVCFWLGSSSVGGQPTYE